MIRILIQGIGGRMGKALCQLIAQRGDCRVVGGIDPAGAPAGCDVPVVAAINENTVQADVLIDFSNPTALDHTVAYCREKKLPCVICTTGLSAAQQEKIFYLAQETAVFQSANMSVGVNLLIALARQAAHTLGVDFDIEIIEKHHRNKLDAPSGTAMMIADALAEDAPAPCSFVYDRHLRREPRSRSEIGIHSVRGGTIVGEHSVLFAGPDEVIELSHSAASRDVFAAGAVNAALFLVDKPAGMYSMKDLIGL